MNFSHAVAITTLLRTRSAVFSDRRRVNLFTLDANLWHLVYRFGHHLHLTGTANQLNDEEDGAITWYRHWATTNPRSVTRICSGLLWHMSSCAMYALSRTRSSLLLRLAIRRLELKVVANKIDGRIVLPGIDGLCVTNLLILITVWHAELVVH